METCRRILILMSVFILSYASHAIANVVPPIRNVGVIPVQWIGNDSAISSMARFKALSESGFTHMVRSAKRFQVLNDEIIEDNWNSANGRKMLVDEFELDGYVSLQLEELDDLIVANVRLLSPALETYLSESDRILKSDIIRMSDEEQSARLRRLAYRTLNRYPIDVFVTSVQGNYITISGGENQNLFEGDILNFQEVRIAQSHPINGSWISYTSKNLGKAQVVDSKQFSAIAKLSSLAFEGAIKVGSSAKIKNINTRKIFERRIPKQDTITASKESRIADLSAPEPQRMTSPIKKPESAPPKPTPAVISTPQYVPPQYAEEDNKNEDMEDPPEATELESSSSSGFVQSTIDFMRQHFVDVHGVAGLNLWKASGDASASASLPFWLFNQFEFWGNSPINDKTNLELRGKLGFGPTDGSNFFSLGLSGALTRRYHNPGTIMSMIDGVEYGAVADLETSQVSASSFGGYNAITMAPVVALYGLHHFVDLESTLEGKLGLRLNLLAFGTAGIAGSNESISGVSGYELFFDSVLRSRPNRPEWGMSFRYKKNSYSAFNYSETFIGLLARLRF